MEAVVRLSSIPVVESGLRNAEDAYFRLKKSSALFTWSLEKIETTLFGAVDTLRPGLKLFEGTISQFDSLLCKSLDLMEQKVPNLYLPPTMMYWNTKEYMSDRLVRPVLKRAESFKELGTAVLESKVCDKAADRLDNFVDAADKYVERYLPETKKGKDEEGVGEDEVDYVDENKNNHNGSTEIHMMQTIHRGQRLSKKLKRRLTIRTIAEAKALKKHSREAIHVLFYAAELMVTDPKMAFQKTLELWAYLSENEPENQARPETMEEFLVLLTREAARRVVHFINYTRSAVVRFPETLKHTQYAMMQQLINVTKALVNLIRTRPITTRLSQEVASFQEKIAGLYDEVQNYATNRLVNMEDKKKQSWALVPYNPNNTISSHSSTNDGRLLHATNQSNNDQFCFTFQFSIHSIVTAERLAIYVSGRLTEEKVSSDPTTFNNNQNNHVVNGGY